MVKQGAIKQNLFPVEEKPSQPSICKSLLKRLKMHLFSILLPLALLASPILATPIELEARDVSHPIPPK